VVRGVIKGKLQTVQSSSVRGSPLHEKEFYRVQKTEVKIRLPGRAVQNADL
jgi:hypothetical protein